MNKEKIKNYFNTSFGHITLFIILIIVTLLALRLGSASLSFNEFIDGLFFKNDTNAIIIYNVRLPRVLAGIIAGAGLSLSGVLLQSILDNPLAAPSVIGINSGAGFFTVLSLLIFIPSFSFNIILTPVFAFIGAFLTTILVITLSHIVGGNKTSIVLAGIAINAIFNSLISLITLINSDVLLSYHSFSIGGFIGVELNNLIIPIIILFICLVISLLLSKQINVLCLGNNTASALGINIKAIRTICIIIASLSAASVVSFSGLIGFIGLIVPHIARKITGNKTKSLLLNSCILGSIITVIADLLGRTLFAPSEMPVGIMLAFIGGPFFIFLLLKQRGKL